MPLAYPRRERQHAVDLGPERGPLRGPAGGKELGADNGGPQDAVPAPEDEVDIEGGARPQPEDHWPAAGQRQQKQAPILPWPRKSRRRADRGSGGGDDQRGAQSRDGAVTAIAQQHGCDQQGQSDDSAPTTQIDRHQTAAAHDPDHSILTVKAYRGRLARITRWSAIGRRRSLPPRSRPGCGFRHLASAGSPRHAP